MMYTPHRDGRFHYLWDLMQFIEREQCRSCMFSKLNDPDEDKDHAEEYPMCYEIEGAIITEEPVEALDDRGTDGVVCTRYKNRVLAEEEHPDQGRLFDERQDTHC